MSGLKFILRRQKAAVRFEKRTAIKVGGRRVAGSGSLPGNKGDVKNEKWLHECKQAKAARFSLTLQLWRKIEWEAIQAGKLPVMVIQMAGRELAVINFNDFLAFRDVL